MNLRTIWKYSFNRASHRLLVCFLTMMLTYIMFLLLLVSWFMWGYIQKEQQLCDNCLSEGMESCGMILFESGDMFNPDFLSELMNVEGLVGFTSGNVGEMPINEVEKYSEQQKALNLEYNENTGCAPWFFMNQFGIEVCQFNLSKGKYPDEWELEDDEQLIYFGGNFQNITIGEKIESKQMSVTYVVGGVLETGSNWICDEIYIYESILDAQYVQCLDNMIVCLEPQMVSGRNTYCIKNGYSMEEVEDRLFEVASKYDVGIVLARLNDVVKENNYQLSYVTNLVRLLTLLVIITSLIVLERTQYSEMINDTEYFGIFLANGASMRDLSVILLGENLIKVGISFVLAAFSGYFMLKLQWQLFQSEMNQWKTTGSVYVWRAILPSMVIGAGIVVFVTIRAIRWLKKKNPAELLRDYKT